MSHVATPLRIIDDARDRMPPPAPKKVKKDRPWGANIVAHPLVWHQVPDAPKKEPRVIKLSAQPVALTELLAPHLAAVWLAKWREYKTDDTDGAAYLALNEVVEVTPLALPDGELKDFLVVAVGAFTFTLDIDELWIEPSFRGGSVATVEVYVEGVGTYKIGIGEISGGATPQKSLGHYEEIGTGKGGTARFWVEAVALN